MDIKLETKQEMDQFLKMYEESLGNMTVSLRYAKVSRTKFLKWKTFKWFASEFRDIDEAVRDDVLKIFIENDVKNPKNTVARIFYLKSRHPDFRETRVFEIKKAPGLKLGTSNGK